MRIKIPMQINTLSFHQVTARVGLSRSRIYQMMREGTFPASISFGEDAVGWIEEELDAWVKSRFETVYPSTLPEVRELKKTRQREIQENRAKTLDHR